MEDFKGLPKDALTGTYTREHMVPILEKRVFDAKVQNRRLSILLVDIDHFKQINDKYGHLWGDEFLKFISSTLRGTLEEEGVIFRYGGDEFVVLFSSPDPKKAYSLAKRFNLVMRKRPFLFNGRLFTITVSCGLATYPDDAHTAKDLLKKADNALYFSKRSGRSTTTLASQISLRRLKLISVVVLEVFIIGALAFFVNTYLLKGRPLENLNRVAMRRLIPVGLIANATITLKNGDVIKGEIVSEDRNRLVVEKPLEQGSYKLYVEKKQIQSILIIP